MAVFGAFLKGVGKAIVGVAVPGLVADVLCEVLPEAARKVADWWKGERKPEERRAEVEALANASPAEIKLAVAGIVAEVAADKPPEYQRQLSVYLSLVPGAVRASLRRPADPAGRTVPPAALLETPESVLSLLPAHLPRFKPGDRPLANIDWELEELLGAGGFGEVWKARNPHFDGVPPVALKFCLDPAAKDRLLRHEAAILNQVMRQGRHPGIVALLHTYLGADPPCLEYEYVAGGDLAGMLQRWQMEKPDPARASRLLLEIARVVGFAHKLSPPIVHRDLKPANILLSPNADGTFAPRVADFGIGAVAAGREIAKSARGVSQGAFLMTALRGAHTPMYASPQQMSGKEADPRDDVFALGVIWYQLLGAGLMGGRPGGTRWMGKLATAGVPQAQVDLLSACLEDDPDDRPKDAAALAAALAALVAPVIEKKPEPPKPPAVPKPAPARRPGLVMALDEVTNSIGMRFVLVPAGSFLMGSPAGEPMRAEDEGPVRPVAMASAFYLGVHPVTQAQYETIVGKNPSHFKKKEGGGPDHPVESVSWDEAAAFCRALAKKEGKPTGAYRLPTEAEWEYACRAGTLTPFAFGDSLSSSQANFDGNRPCGGADAGPFLQRTSKAGAYKPNAWGLHDMHGNVWEWCADATPDRQRIVRGGSWNNSGHLCRSARRQRYDPGHKAETVGFRVALALG